MPTKLSTASLRFIRENLHLSDKLLSDHLGVSRTWVTIIRGKHGMVKIKPDCRNNRGLTQTAKEMILNNHPQISIRKLSKLTGHDRKTISKFINN